MEIGSPEGFHEFTPNLRRVAGVGKKRGGRRAYDDFSRVSVVRIWESRGMIATNDPPPASHIHVQVDASATEAEVSITPVHAL